MTSLIWFKFCCLKINLCGSTTDFIWSKNILAQHEICGLQLLCFTIFFKTNRFMHDWKITHIQTFRLYLLITIRCNQIYQLHWMTRHTELVLRDQGSNYDKSASVSWSLPYHLHGAISRTNSVLYGSGNFSLRIWDFIHYRKSISIGGQYAPLFSWITLHDFNG